MPVDSGHDLGVGCWQSLPQLFSASRNRPEAFLPINKRLSQWILKVAIIGVQLSMVP